MSRNRRSSQFNHTRRGGRGGRGGDSNRNSGAQRSSFSPSVRPPRENRDRSLPPGFSRRSRGGSPERRGVSQQSPVDDAGGGNRLVVVDRARLMDSDVPLLGNAGGFDGGRGGRVDGLQGQTVPLAQAVKRVPELPPHLQPQTAPNPPMVNAMHQFPTPSLTIPAPLSNSKQLHVNQIVLNQVPANQPQPPPPPTQPHTIHTQLQGLQTLQSGQATVLQTPNPPGTAVQLVGNISLPGTGTMTTVVPDQNKSPVLHPQLFHGSQSQETEGPVRGRRSPTPVLDIAAYSNSDRTGSLDRRGTGQVGMEQQPKKKQRKELDELAKGVGVGSVGFENGAVSGVLVGMHSQGMSLQGVVNSSAYSVLDARLQPSMLDQAGGQMSQEHQGHQPAQPQAQSTQVPLESVHDASTPTIPGDQCIAEVRLLLSERMHESALRGQGECGILEGSIPADFTQRFGRPLSLSGTGFNSVRALVGSKCGDIVQLKQLKVGQTVRMGYIPTVGFKADANGFLLNVRNSYSEVLSPGTGLHRTRESAKVDNGNVAENAQVQTQVVQRPSITPCMLSKMVKNMLRSIMRDVNSGIRQNVTVDAFVDLFSKNYSYNLDPKELGYGSMEAFLTSAQVDSIVKFVRNGDEMYLFPSEQYLNEKPPVLAGLHGKGPLVYAAGHTVQNPSLNPSLNPSRGVRNAVEGGEEGPTHSKGMTMTNQGSLPGVVGQGHELAGSGAVDVQGLSTRPMNQVNAGALVGMQNRQGSSSGGYQVVKIGNEQYKIVGSGVPTGPVSTQRAGTVDVAMNGLIMGQLKESGVVRDGDIAARVGSSTVNNGYGQERAAQSTVGVQDRANVSWMHGSSEKSGSGEYTGIDRGGGHGHRIVGYEQGQTHGHTHAHAQGPSNHSNHAVHRVSSSLEHQQGKDGHANPADGHRNGSDALGKVRELVMKHVVATGGPLLLNKLPLLFYNETGHTLNYQQLGYESLMDLVGYLYDIVSVADSGDGMRLLVPVTLPNTTAVQPRAVQSYEQVYYEQHEGFAHSQVPVSADQSSAYTTDPAMPSQTGVYGTAPQYAATSMQLPRHQTVPYESYNQQAMGQTGAVNYGVSSEGQQSSHNIPPVNVDQQYHQHQNLEYYQHYEQHGYGVHGDQYVQGNSGQGVVQYDGQHWSGEGGHLTPGVTAYDHGHGGNHQAGW